MADDEILDNLAWHALSGPLSHFGSVSSDGRVRRFHPEVSIFSAVEGFDPSLWDALGDAVGAEGVAVLFRDQIPPPPPGWTVLGRFPALQLVAGSLPPVPSGVELVELGPREGAEMAALAALAEPGPFGPRTHELGVFLGVRRDGELIAMAGQRFRAGEWVEISAVSTHPDARREGLGAAVTLAVAHRIVSDGARPMLHVRAENAGALALYQQLGFDVRREIDAAALRPS